MNVTDSTVRSQVAGVLGLQALRFFPVGTVTNSKSDSACRSAKAPAARPVEGKTATRD